MTAAPTGWAAAAAASPGLRAASAEVAADAMPDDATHDRFCGDWWLHQRRRGHRTSADDLLTAWLAASMVEGRRVERYADLGCGIGSVLLMTTHAVCPGAALGVEAQRQSVRMAHQSVVELPAGAPPVALLWGDLRAVDPERFGQFDLVTGSPPYLPVGTGVPSPDPQREACRFELRGGVEDYCLAAARLLAPDGCLALVFQSRWTERVRRAIGAAGLEWTDQVDVAMRRDDETPFLSVYGAAHPGARRPAAAVVRRWVREPDGSESADYRAMRASLGLVR